MKIEEIKNFVCEECGKKYNNKENAINCENQDKKNSERENLTEFEIKEEHLKLLKNMYVHWDNCEFGAPTIDCKRPYGNSNAIEDIAEIIGFEKTKKRVDFDRGEASEYDNIQEYLEEAEWNDKSWEYLQNLHRNMEIVLQIVLSTLSFKKGKYRKNDKYSSEWKLIEEVKRE